jgi:NADH:ubiquinone reductase (H+-translocating)
MFDQTPSIRYHPRMAHRVVIVGGGFGGVTAAKALKQSGLRDIDITVISDKPHLEYYGVLYRLIRGESPDEACLPLRVVLGKGIRRVIDTVEKVDAAKKMVQGKHGSYIYDTLILAPGSVAAYFGIAGMEEQSITMKSAEEAVAIRRRVIRQVTAMVKAVGAERRRLGSFVVIGGGPTGIEAAGEILPLACKTAHRLGSCCCGISVTLLEGADRLLPTGEQTASQKILDRLRQLGVHVRLQCAVTAADNGSVTLTIGEQLNAATVIWTAGVKAHPLLETVAGLERDKRGRAVVDAFLRVPKHPEIFVVGDCAATQYSGMAQTAVEDGHFVAQVLKATLTKTVMPVYKPNPPAYAIPAGTMWSAVKFGPLRVYGLMGSVLRRAADIHVYMLILPWYRIPAAFFGRSMRKKDRISATADA